ncbi:MAG: type II toxin-antitoxin system RelE/ParE family toxin [Ghiorsea sp.]
MILDFIHKGLEKFYRTGSKAGIQANHADKLRRILSNLDVASCADDLDLPSYRLHELKGSRQVVWSITVQANWRVTFRFVGEDIELINYEDYH